ncbi:pleiotropic regulatory protein [Aquipluma nitroreducens]|uniref:Pleiotropic regulatory protein n=1 Tax=Aquipluma nitroreducens TaxID=2010828 RepID=A0A5K7SBD5_9BACT|nr:DegT/DnrJ/EryC1/StrS family aminotransferase [Aquipluma nitroreducens]BBE18893.1 pleiotropic regulatory protein [Aquipluma nitroreducens]
MVDLFSQYQKIKPQINSAIQDVLDTTDFIKGKQVVEFENNLTKFTGSKYAITCANGTDALQIALMALDLEIGDEVIVPGFTYAATAEVIALLRLIPVMVDVDPKTFNISISELKRAITKKTKAIVPVHLFGQCSDMEPIMKIAQEHKLWIIEDNAQSFGAEYMFSDGTTKQTGTIGHIGSTSFFPTKNLGCFGDGGALFTNDDILAEKIRMIANHGQKIKYHHSIIGCNSRLDTIQAAVLNVKLEHLNEHLNARKKAADFYDNALANWQFGQIPQQINNINHTYNQYTLIIKNGRRDELKSFLAGKGIPSMIYYPIPLYKQDAFNKYVPQGFELPNTEQLCRSVLSVPIHTEMNEDILLKITDTLKSFK